MADKPITFKIDVTKILKEHLYKGAKATYLDCVVWPSKEVKYGQTHYIVQSVGKEAREAGVKGPIIGNLSMPEREERVAQRTAPAARPKPPADPDLDAADLDIPF